MAEFVQEEAINEKDSSKYRTFNGYVRSSDPLIHRTQALLKSSPIKWATRSRRTRNETLPVRLWLKKQQDNLCSHKVLWLEHHTTNGRPKQNDTILHRCVKKRPRKRRNIHVWGRTTNKKIGWETTGKRIYRKTTENGAITRHKRRSNELHKKRRLDILFQKQMQTRIVNQCVKTQIPVTFFSLHLLMFFTRIQLNHILFLHKSVIF